MKNAVKSIGNSGNKNLNLPNVQKLTLLVGIVTCPINKIHCLSCQCILSFIVLWACW